MIDVYLPAIISMVIGYLGLMGIPIAIAEYKEQGVLKRYHVSPLPLWAFFAVHVAVQFTLLLIMSAVLVMFGSVIFGIRFTFVSNLGPVIVALLVGTFSLCALGFAVVSPCTTRRTAQAIGSVLFFAMLFPSGAVVPRSEFGY